MEITREISSSRLAHARVRPWTVGTRAMLLAVTAPIWAAGTGIAQGSPGAVADKAWSVCAATADSAARLECYDRWAQAQGATSGRSTASDTSSQAPAIQSAPPGHVASAHPQAEGCHDERYSELSRFWELEGGSSCGTFRFRGYRPLSFALVGSNWVNQQPTSDAPGHSVTAPVNYKRTETRLQLSMRTKLAQGLLTDSGAAYKDSFWFAYSQQSYWQVFSADISRPFRTTDHEPELVYVYPSSVNLPFQGRLRYSGLGLVHQSNGQSLPLSRSWNRLYLMAGAEWGSRWLLQGRLWQRASESAENDDNPGIENTIGRAEIKASWRLNPQNAVSMTARHSLRTEAKGSTRLEWLRTLNSPDDGGRSNLRLHTQIFSGYGDSLLDYNRQRITYSMGLSLLDF
jgi:phospholipase A1